MGNWKETCALSHLPIKGYDKVHLIIMTTKKKASRCDKNSVYHNIQCLPIQGQYNGYGALEFIDEDNYNSKAIVSFVNEAFERGKWGLSARGQLARNKKDKVGYPYECLTEIVLDIEREYLVEIHTNTYIYFAMILTDVYKAAVQSCPDADIDYKSYVEDYVQTITTPLIKPVKEKGDSHKKYMLKVSDYLELREETQEVSAIVLDMFNWLARKYPYQVHNKVFLRSMQQPENVELFIEDLITTIKFINFLRAARLSLSLQIGAGSQDADYITITSFYNKVITIAKKVQSNE